jgi:hypothetical protein
MKKALIDSVNSRVIQVVEIGEEFETAPALYWVDCPTDTKSYYLYDPKELTFEDPHAGNKDEFGNAVEPFSMQRMRAYPGAGDQMDMLWRELRDTGTISVNGEWFQSIIEIKNAIPKPEGWDPADPISTTTTQWIGADGQLVKLYTGLNGSTDSNGLGAEFKVRQASDSYQVIAILGGGGYSVNDIVSFTDVDAAGVDCSIVVTEVDDTGGIITVSVN